MNFFDNWEEIIIGGICSSIFLYFIVKWWVLPIMLICGLLWRLGGWEHGSKLFRRIGVPICVCGASVLVGTNPIVLCAIPFMVWLAPSYGKESWLFKILKNDFLTRLICFGWYWTAFAIAYAIAINV